MDALLESLMAEGPSDPDHSAFDTGVSTRSSTGGITGGTTGGSSSTGGTTGANTEQPDSSMLNVVDQEQENHEPQDRTLPAIQGLDIVDGHVSADGAVSTEPSSVETPGVDTVTDIDIDVDAQPTEPKRVHPIEIVLPPVADPESYLFIAPSSTIERILNIEVDEDNTFYTIEFADGRIQEMCAWDDVIHCKGARAAIDRYQPPRFGSQSAMAGNQKHGRSEDEYEESESDAPRVSKRPKRAVNQVQRATRYATRQASASMTNDDSDSDRGQGRHIIRVSEDSEGDPMASTTRTSQLSRATKRNLRARAPVALVDSGDELAQDYQYDDDGDDFVPIVSDITGASKRSTKKKVVKARARPARKIVYDDGDSEIEFENKRRSARDNRNTKSMRDPDFDEFDLIEERQTNAPKHASVKEIFQELDPDSAFVKMHSDKCDSCGSASSSRGPLVHCQGCSYSYHKACIGLRAQRDHRVTKVGHEDFVLQCKFCIQFYKKKDKDGRAPDHALCQACHGHGASCSEFSTKKTPKVEEKLRTDNGGEDPITEVQASLLNNADNVLFRCSSCRRAYHFEHMPSTTATLGGGQDIKDQILSECLLSEWHCLDCLDAKTINALVAWRPLDTNILSVGQTQNIDYSEDEIEYLVQWSRRSHYHDTWMPGPWVYGIAQPTMRTSFLKRESQLYPKMTTEAAIEEEWLLADVILNVKYRTRVNASTKEEEKSHIDDIVSVLVKFQGLSYDEVVWDEPPPKTSEGPWTHFSIAYDEYLTGKYFANIPDHKMRDRIAAYRALDFGEECELKSQPSQLTKGQLMEYQMEGVNFLLYNFHQRHNVILADEMGLGKTVQIVAFISALTHTQPCCWPFLVVVPNATCPNWRRELKNWAPDLRVVTYHGGKAAQDLAYKHELFPEGTKNGMKAHVVIMSYEAAANVRAEFHGVKWVGLIVDEGQRLKNENTLLYKNLEQMKIPCRILLTGTPLQNNKRELFNLLHFIDPQRNAEELDARYAVLTKENLPELHKLIRPYFLRRTKAQVLKFLPGMAQIILPVTMTVIQEKLSKSIMARNPDLIKAIMSRTKVKASERKSLNNILADLRQCLCHPFCFNSEVEDKSVSPEQMHRNLVEASPKLLLLNVMLPRLKQRGHRVLIFSQFLHSLTIIEDFLTGLGLEHNRIDGNLSALEKQKRIDAYNAPDSTLFAMLLSTRAGGVGINLATADTVIIYDPDFNPHQDIQALSRAHRIGQKNKVLCFQLTTKNTVEEKIMQMGKRKMALDHALIESMDAKEEAGEDLESILKHGAAALFSNESGDKIIYDEASVDRLLDRSQAENTSAGDDASAETQFSFARVWENNKGDLAISDGSEANNADDVMLEATSIWENIIKEREREHQEELKRNQREYGRGARRRGTQGVDYLNRQKGADLGDSENEGSGDELYIDQNDMDDDDDDEGNASDAFGQSGQTNGQTTTARSTRKVYGQLVEVSLPSTQPVSAKPPDPRPTPVAVLNQTSLPPQRPRPKTKLPTNQVSQPPLKTQPLVVEISRPVAGPNRSMNNPSVAVSTVPIVPSQMLPSQHNKPGPSSSGAPHALPIHHPYPAVQLPNGTWVKNGKIGGGSPCSLCQEKHDSLEHPCIDLNMEKSIRLTLDRLQHRRDDEAIEAAVKFLRQRLDVVTSPNWKHSARQSL
ncbi:PHD/FYVE-zinc-finger like domain-containing protein [Xylariaceae sp. FL1272]|nr:PHD/FYVE-zinc-finger like domain-containing protein [Xylariaceae sp. FL1272]